MYLLKKKVRMRPFFWRLRHFVIFFFYYYSAFKDKIYNTM